MLLRPLNSKPHYLLANCLSETQLAVCQDKCPVVDHDTHLLIRPHGPFPNPLHIGRNVDDAMRVVSGQVRCNQVISNGLSLQCIASGRGKNRASKLIESSSINFKFLLLPKGSESWLLAPILVLRPQVGETRDRVSVAF